ncbi:hypothetical protein [Roseivirga sp.]|uniref:hypothetical protein n=1 Tax=Roseivirga sp. TaxID=1964215 RepID=UPI003B52E6BD
MAIGKVGYYVYLTALPNNWKVEVTKIENVNVPDGFSLDFGSVPYTISSPDQVGYALAASDIQAEWKDDGDTMAVNLYFTVTDDAGNSKKGYIQAGTTEWFHIERPDYILLTIGWIGEAPMGGLSISVGDLVNPGSFSMGFGKDDKNNIFMVASSDDDNQVTKELVGKIVDGSITAITDTLKWVIASLL